MATDLLEEDSQRASPETLFKQYEGYVDLFNFYLDSSVKAVTWFYGITGAILSFFFSHQSDKSMIRFALLLPALMSVGLAAIFLYSSTQVKEMATYLKELQRRLGLVGTPHVQVLLSFLVLSGILFVIVGSCLFVYFCAIQPP